MARQQLQRGGLCGWLGVVLLLNLCEIPSVAAASLQFLEFGASEAALTGSLPRGSEVYSDPILIDLPNGFPFSNSSESVVYVSVNGFLSFRTGRGNCCPEAFDSTSTLTHIIAPYWIDNDITTAGEVVYEVIVNGSQLEQVSSAVSEEVGVAFEGVWMLAVYWNNVPTQGQNQRNSYQAVLVTDGERSYALFLYNCDLLTSSGAGIGYYASGNFYENHALANDASSDSVACGNSPHTVWNTVIYPIHYAGVRAVIRSTPEGPVFWAAQYIDLRCHVITPGSYTFSWESYCTETEQLVSSHPGFTSVSDLLSVRSTPYTCLDEVVCKATDETGSETTATFQLTNVTGVGVFHRISSMLNNTGLEADSGHQLGRISCHSASREPHIGRWIAPSGDDISFSSDSIFSVEFHSGDFPSYTVLSVSPGAVFSEEHEGVYSCVIPDEDGVEQTVHFGLYDTGYSSRLSDHPLSLRRTYESPFTLTCSSTSLPPYFIWWLKGGDVISNGDPYSISSVLTDRPESTYENQLTIASENDVDLIAVIYKCVILMQVQPYDETDRPDPVVSSYSSYAVMNEVGTRWSITCTSPDGTASTRWTIGGSVINRAQGNVVGLHVDPVNDMHHNEEYVCLGLNSGGAIVYQLHFTLIVHVPDSALTVSVSEVGNPQIGQPFALRCLASKRNGLSNSATADWSHDLSHDPSHDPSLNTDPMNSTTSSLTFRDLRFSELRTSHAGVYECVGGLQSRALDEPLMKSVEYNLELTIPMATVTLTTPPTASVFRAGSDLILTCTATLPPTVDTEVTGVVTWDTPQGTLTESTGRVTLSALQTGSHTHQFTLHISPLSHVSDEGDYGCSVVFHSTSPSPSLLPSPHPAVSNAIHVHISLNGAALYHSSHGYLLNNSIITATDQGSIGTIHCISDSTHPPSGHDGWTTPTDRSGVFNITHSSEGGLQMGLVDGAVFSEELEGVYTCVISDEEGDLHYLSVGIYQHGFSAGVTVMGVSLGGAEGVFTVDCLTASSPPTNLTWSKDGRPLEPSPSELTFSQTQVVVDRRASEYISSLMVEGPLSLVTGAYQCRAENEYGISSSMELLVTGIEVTPEGDVFTLGQPASLSCTSDLRGAAVEWISLSEDDITPASVTGDGGSSLLQFASVSEDLHDRVYVCHVTTPYGSLEEEHRLTVSANTDDFQLTVTASSRDAIVGEPYTLTCSFTTPPGTLGTPTVQWVDGAGDVVPDTTAVSSHVSVDEGGVIVVLSFPSLSHDHMGCYTCVADVSLTVSPFQITKSQTSTITPGDLPPEIPQASIAAISITTDSAVIQWLPGDTRHLVSEVAYTVEYGETELFEAGTTAPVVLGPEVKVLSEVKILSVSLSGLLPGTTYSYRIVASTGIGQDYRTGTETFTTKELDKAPPAGTQRGDNGGVIGAVVAIMVVMVVVVVVATGLIVYTLRRKRNEQIYAMSGRYPHDHEPPNKHAPPPYTTGTHHHPHTTPHNGHGEYAVVGNGTYSHVMDSNCAYGAVAPPLPPARNSTLDPDLILPYAETSTYIKMEHPPPVDTLETSRGQSPHRIETENPLYASADTLEPLYSQLSDEGTETSQPHQPL